MGVKGILLSTCAVAALVVLPLSTPTAVLASEASPRPAGVVDISRIRIDNFGQASPDYYRGEQPEGRDYADLAAIGIRTVIDLQADGNNLDEPQRVEAAGMKFYRIPMTTHGPPTTDQLATFLQIVTDSANQPVYVHCAGGKHRTGVMTAVFRMEHDRWTADQAFREMKQYKFGLDFLHPEFKRFVYSYQAGRTAPTVAAVSMTN